MSSRNNVLAVLAVLAAAAAPALYAAPFNNPAGSHSLNSRAPPAEGTGAPAGDINTTPPQGGTPGTGEIHPAGGPTTRPGGTLPVAGSAGGPTPTNPNTIPDIVDKLSSLHLNPTANPSATVTLIAGDGPMGRPRPGSHAAPTPPTQQEKDQMREAMQKSGLFSNFNMMPLPSLRLQANQAPGSAASGSGSRPLAGGATVPSTGRPAPGLADGLNQTPGGSGTGTAGVPPSGSNTRREETTSRGILEESDAHDLD